MPGLIQFHAAPSESSARPQLIPTFTGSDYLSMFASGALCCTITHGMMCPIDVVKTRIQLQKIKGVTMFEVGRNLVEKEGASVLLTGFGATSAGYLLQGGAKFAGYEFWKRQAVINLSPESAVSNRTSIYLISAALAEITADALLCPLEATRIRLVSKPDYASSLFPALLRYVREDGLAGLYSGYIPLLFKQVPYSCGQFVVFEWGNEMIASNFNTSKFTGLQSTLATLTSGVIAGIAAAILSHPADTLLSKINGGRDSQGLLPGGEGSNMKRLLVLAKETGFSGLWNGLMPRIFMTCFLVSGQFLLYSHIKKALNAPAGIDIHKN